jgi:hypothetical protein
MQSQRDEFGSDERSDAPSNRSSTELDSVSMTSSQRRYGFTRSMAPSASSSRQVRSLSASPTSISQLQGYIPGQGLAGAPDLTPTIRYPLYYVEPSQTDRPEINQPMSYWTVINDGTTQPADVSPPPSQYRHIANQHDQYSPILGTSPTATITPHDIAMAHNEQYMPGLSLDCSIHRNK